MEKTAEEIQAEKDAIELAKNEAQKANNSNTDERDEWKRKAEQAEMRARQLENEKRDREKADDVARQKQLEEQNEYKTLYERAQARATELETAQEEASRRSATSAAETNLLAEYSTEVTKLATSLNLGLSDDSDEAKASLKSKLDSLQAQFPTATTKKVVGNNGGDVVVSSDEVERTKALGRMRFSDNKVASAAKRSVISQIPALAEMRRNAGLTE